MSLGLLEGYSDNDFSDLDEEDNQESQENSDEGQEDSGGNDEEGGEVKTKNFFLDEDESSNEDDDEEYEDLPSSSLAPIRKKKKGDLPSASQVLGKRTASSVFRSDYEQSEEDNQHILEKHVKLTESFTGDRTVDKVRAPCKPFRKGRCRRGDRCRFSHVLPGGLLSNMAHSEKQKQEELKELKKKRKEKKKEEETYYPADYEQEADGMDEKEKMELAKELEEEAEERRIYKKKYGMPTTLMPTKQFMAIFGRHMPEQAINIGPQNTGNTYLTKPWTRKH